MDRRVFQKDYRSIFSSNLKNKGTDELFYSSLYSSVILCTTKLPIRTKVRIQIVPLKTKLPLALTFSPK